MADTETKTARVAKKVADSQERLKRDSNAPKTQSSSASRDKKADPANPPETFRSLAAEYPLLTIAGGMAIGLVVARLLPKGAARRLAGQAVTAATVAGELGLSFGKQATEKVGSAGREGLSRLEELGETVSDRFGDLTGTVGSKLGNVAGTVSDGASDLRDRARDAAETTRSSGMKLASQAIKLASRIGR